MSPEKPIDSSQSAVHSDGSDDDPIAMGNGVPTEDSDDESNGFAYRMNAGYQLLPQEPDFGDNELDDADSDAVIISQDGDAPNVAHTRVVVSLFREALEDCNATSEDPSSTGSESSSLQPEMDQAHIDKIKTAMANISLPPSAIPDWASVVPEEQWKAWLVERIRSGGKPPEDGNEA